MTTEPEREDVLESPLAEAAGSSSGRRWSPIATLEAAVLGIGDTLKDMLHAGQEEAQRAHNEAWQRYDELTKHRRDRPDKDDDED